MRSAIGKITTNQGTTYKQTEEFTRTEVVIFIVSLCLGVLLLSWFFFSKQSLRLDEAQSLWQTSHSPQVMLSIVAQDVHVPLYHIILHYWQYYFGNDVIVARLLSLIFYVLIIPAVYLLGKSAFSKTVGLYAAILVAISPFLNWYGNEIRMYSLFTLLIILNQYFFIQIFRSKREGVFEDVHGSIWLGYVVTVVVGVFTHYFFIFNLITQALFFMAYRHIFPQTALRTFVMSALLAAVIFSPWARYVYQMGSASNTQPHLLEPSSIDVFNTFSQFIFGFQTDTINTVILSLWPLVVLLVFVSLRKNQRVSPVSVYLFASLFAPILLAYVISVGIKAIYLTRYLVLALPSLYILISWVLSTYPPKLARILKVGLFAAMLIGLGIQIFSANIPVKEDYREASNYLTENATPQDIIVLSAPFTIYPFEYYYEGPSAIQTLPIWNRTVTGPIPAFSSAKLPGEIDTIKGSHQVLWLLLSYDQGYEDEIKLYFDTNFQRIDSKSFSPGMNLYAYRLRYDDQSLTDILDSISITNVSVQNTAQNSE